MQFGKNPALGIALFLFFASFALRASLTETSPFLMDEAQSLEAALKIAQGQKVEPPLLEKPTSEGAAAHPGPAFYYWMALPLFFSPSPEAASLWTAFSCAIAVVFAFFAFREWLSLRGAAIGALWMAYSPWSLLFSDRISSAHSVILPLCAALYFFARWIRDPERIAFWLGLVGCIAIIPQFHLASAGFAVALLPLMLPKLREVRLKGWLSGLALFAVLSAPYALHELRTRGANMRALFSEVTISSSALNLQAPLSSVRLLTLDGTPFDLKERGEPLHEGRLFETLWTSTPERPLAWPHWMLRLWSWGLAFAVVWVGLKNANPLRTLFLTGVLVHFASLVLIRQADFPTNAAPLFPFVFGLAALWGEHALRKRPVSLALILGAFCIGGTLEATSVSRRLHAKNSVGEQRKVVEALLAQNEQGSEPKVYFSYPTMPETYAFLARTQYDRELRILPTSAEEADFHADLDENGRVIVRKIR